VKRIPGRSRRGRGNRRQRAVFAVSGALQSDPLSPSSQYPAECRNGTHSAPCPLLSLINPRPFQSTSNKHSFRIRQMNPAMLNLSTAWARWMGKNQKGGMNTNNKNDFHQLIPISFQSPTAKQPGIQKERKKIAQFLFHIQMEKKNSSPSNQRKSIPNSPVYPSDTRTRH